MTKDAFAEMLELHDVIQNDVWFERDEVLTSTGEVLLPGGVNAYHRDTCWQYTPLINEYNWKRNTVDDYVSEVLLYLKYS